jgi:hypothetical protein
MSQIYKQKDPIEDSFDAGFKIPDTKSILQRLETSSKDILRQEHKEEMSEEEKPGKQKKRQKPKGGSVCCCEDPNCRIGPFIEKQGE